MSMLQFCFASFSPRWLAACPGERSGQRRWQQSPHTPCSQAESGPHSHRSTQTPPGIRRGEGEWRRLLLLGLPTDALSFGCEATLTSIVTLHSQADAGTFLLQLFSLSTRRGGSGANTLKCDFAVDEMTNDLVIARFCFFIFRNYWTSKGEFQIINSRH